jgi:segregation and condensation protein B
MSQDQASNPNSEHPEQPSMRVPQPQPTQTQQTPNVAQPTEPTQMQPLQSIKPAELVEPAKSPAGVTEAAVQAQSETAETQQAEEIKSVGDPVDKKQHNIAMLEAALYVAGRPLDLNEICSVLTTRSKKKAEQLLEELSQDYAARNTAMEILRLKDERYVMQIKPEFTPLIKRLVNRPLLSSGPLKTLSYIAYRQPITSKRVIEVRGQHAYGHIKLLKDMGLIAPERSGRAIVLKTTDYFADYFGLTMDTASLKRELKRIFGEAFKEEAPP